MDFLKLDTLLQQALEEDLGHGDVTTEAVLGQSGYSGSGRVGAKLVSGQEFVLAGWPVFVRVFELLGETDAQSHYQEGNRVGQGVVGNLSAHPSVLLGAERVALNFLQRMSGVATETDKYVRLVAHTKAKILDTRKTTPLWRHLQKYAVTMGGGRNHRFGLYDGVLIKENHIAIAGGIEPSIKACREMGSHLHRVEVEVRTLEELDRAVEADADVVLLDNMSPPLVGKAVERVEGRCLLEVSGGVTESNVVQFAETGVDFISIGLLTHSFRSIDLSFLLES